MIKSKKRMLEDATLKLWELVKQSARKLKRELFTLAQAIKHPLVPWYAKTMAAIVVAYAFSPIDLIPDFIPVLGLLDDVILVPLGIYLAIKMIPDSALKACRKLADEKENVKNKNWFAGGFIIFIWVVFVAWLFFIFIV